MDATQHDRQGGKAAASPAVGALIGLLISLSIIVYTYDYAVGVDPSITDFWFFLWQKPYRLLQFAVSLFPVGIGFFLGRERQEKLGFKLTAQTLDRLMHRLSRAHEEERQRISRELHDGLAQNLSGIILKANSIKTTAEEPEARKQLDQLADLAKETVVDLRRLIRDLRPTTLDSDGLEPTLQRHLEQFGREYGLKTELTIDSSERLPTGVETALFRIVQESLNNVAKHAGAGRVTVKVAADRDQARVLVTDDGRGFEPGSAAGELSGYGLITMRERAESLGGTLSVDSRPGAGTAVTASVPLVAEKV